MRRSRCTVGIGRPLRMALFLTLWHMASGTAPLRLRSDAELEKLMVDDNLVILHLTTRNSLTAQAARSRFISATATIMNEYALPPCLKFAMMDCARSSYCESPSIPTLRDVSIQCRRLPNLKESCQTRAIVRDRCKASCAGINRATFRTAIFDGDEDNEKDYHVSATSTAFIHLGIKDAAREVGLNLITCKRRGISSNTIAIIGIVIMLVIAICILFCFFAHARYRQKMGGRVKIPGSAKYQNGSTPQRPIAGDMSKSLAPKSLAAGNQQNRASYLNATQTAAPTGSSAKVGAMLPPNANNAKPPSPRARKTSPPSGPLGWLKIKMRGNKNGPVPAPAAAPVPTLAPAPVTPRSGSIRVSGGVAKQQTLSQGLSNSKKSRVRRTIQHGSSAGSSKKESLGPQNLQKLSSGERHKRYLLMLHKWKGKNAPVRKKKQKTIDTVALPRVQGPRATAIMTSDGSPSGNGCVRSHPTATLLAGRGSLPYKNDKSASEPLRKMSKSVAVQRVESPNKMNKSVAQRVESSPKKMSMSAAQRAELLKISSKSAAHHGDAHHSRASVKNSGVKAPSTSVRRMASQPAPRTATTSPKLPITAAMKAKMLARHEGKAPGRTLVLRE
eukprot:GEMP01009409.1.p1 GENE.GEMP01009409.1~~GEMP01009409.1.p1  ORF type:complete len:615 (+),score=110.55 GEMP01009409.1:464-2308(+)